MTKKSTLVHQEIVFLCFLEGQKMTHNCVQLSAGEVNEWTHCSGWLCWSLHHAVPFTGLFPERSRERTHFSRHGSTSVWPWSPLVRPSQTEKRQGSFPHRALVWTGNLLGNSLELRVGYFASDTCHTRHNTQCTHRDTLCWTSFLCLHLFVYLGRGGWSF